MMVDMVLCLENAVLAKFLSLFKKQKIPDLNHQKVNESHKETNVYKTYFGN